MRNPTLLAFALALSPPAPATLAAEPVPANVIARVPNPQLSSDLINLPGDLRAVPAPEPANITDFIRDRRAAILLGKALFWDMQVGSDGVVACATCHFHAGADPRSRHQLSPGLKRLPEPDRLLDFARWNHRLEHADFPLTRLAVDGVRGALDPTTDSNDVVSSQGVHYLAPEDDPQGFALGGRKVRRVEPRNTPSVINAVFNHRQFWDGRAEAVFNGVNHLGERDADARVLAADGPGRLSEVLVRLDRSSLASQAVAPLTSDIEMSRPGRTVRDVGQELLGARARAPGRIAPGSLLFGFTRAIGSGVFGQQSLVFPKWSGALALLETLEALPGIGPMSVVTLRWEGMRHAPGSPGHLREIVQRLSGQQRLLGRRLHALRPLAKQRVHPDDSVLGHASAWPGPGLRGHTYASLIQQAFQPRWWNSRAVVRVHEDGRREHLNGRVAPAPAGAVDHSLLEYNFALFFGLAVQMYEATLVSDDSPWDRFRRAHPSPQDPALNPWLNEAPQEISRLALFGAHLFNDRSRGPQNVRCSNCHEGAEMTDASVSRVTSLGPVRNRDGNVIDRGFNNIGIRPSSDDLGLGASDSFGPLSFSRREFPGSAPASYGGALVTKGFGVDGAMKIPGLRNVALTAPYFHNGDVATLEEAVRLYSRGGNVAPVLALDGTPIEPLGVPRLTDDEVAAIVAFLEALTDERVRRRSAPFDHPQLFVPDGHRERRGLLQDVNGDGLADDAMVEVPAVGSAGGVPLKSFLED